MKFTFLRPLVADQQQHGKFGMFLQELFLKVPHAQISLTCHNTDGGPHFKGVVENSESYEHMLEALFDKYHLEKSHE